MNLQKIRYKLHSGKNNKLCYYIRQYTLLSIPRCLRQIWRKRMIDRAKHRSDYPYILERVNYYNKLNPQNFHLNQEEWNSKAVSLKEQPMTGQKVYYLDTMEYARCFDSHLLWHLLPGDVTHIEDIPSITKSRPIGDNNQCSILMKMDKVRHFIFVKDKIPFAQKKDMAIFRGKIGGKDIRLDFVKRFFGNPRFDVGTIDLVKPEWKCAKMSIYDHLKYKYIMALEGNDVASNLKWIMSSNSIAVMPQPTYETWFMEGKLIPDYHYIEVKPDFSNLEEKMDYYTQHPDEAEEIIRHAHEYVEQFKDKKREDIISLMVLDKYFSATQQE